MKITFSFKPEGVCSKEIIITLNSALVVKIEFVGGCPGGLAGIAALAQGMHIDEVIERLQMITCGDRCTSCADQLARALQKRKVKNEQ